MKMRLTIVLLDDVLTHLHWFRCLFLHFAAFGRFINPEYRIFLDILTDARADYTAQKKVKLLLLWQF